ncbi:hypothetical protein OG528_15035 [Streptomyces platensis]|uniref:hypothetical protein n=1 Tax=Streptomyces platensis TaxID=58346 RepID=UPI0030E3B7E4
MYTEDQIHHRSYAGPEAGKWLTRILQNAPAGGQLSYIGEHGDTMFNIGQMNRALAEISETLSRNPDLFNEASALTTLIQETIKKRGYIWISGD